MRLAIALPFVLAALPAWAADIAVESRPSAVTVFPDRALVTRGGQAKLPAGSHVLVLDGLPSTLIPQSLRVGGSGVAGLVIGSVESKVVASQELVHEQERALNARLVGLKDQRKQVEAQGRALQVRQTFIESLAEAAAEGLKGENADGQMRPEQWEQAWSRLQAGSEESFKAMAQQEVALRGVDEQIRKVEADLRAVRTGARSVTRLRVQVEAPKDGMMEVAVQYQVPNASWYPVYDARLATETARLSLSQYGTVRQRTGEDWSEVSLVLSTAQPAQGSQMPELHPWWIQPLQPMAVGSAAPAAMPPPAPMAKAERQRSLRVAEADEEAAPAEQRSAEVVVSEFAAEYRIPGKLTVPADNAEHRFAISTRDMPAALSARIVPKLSPKAYLHAEIKVEGEAPTLAGPVSLYRDGTYIGGSRLASFKPGDTAQLSFGVDDKVTVEYLPQRGQSGEQGFISKEKRIERRFRTNLANLHGRPLKVMLYDQLPVSRAEEIKVALLDKETTPGFAKDDRDRPGVLAWTWEAKPGEKKSFDFGYVVTYPPDKPPAGL